MYKVMKYRKILIKYNVYLKRLYFTYENAVFTCKNITSHWYNWIRVCISLAINVGMGGMGAHDISQFVQFP